MKKKLLIILLCIGTINITAQTTHDLDWERDVINVDLTIEAGDTVRWTWIDNNHTVENVPGSSVETFSSGFLGPAGSVYSYTFTVVGNNDYFCGIHGADSMNGTITVEPALSVNEFNITNFSLSPNPASSILNIKFPGNFVTGSFTVYDITGKQILTKTIYSNDTLDINVSNWNIGIYLVKVISENNTQTKRLIIQ